MLLETFMVLALWLMFVWFYDPDGFRARRVPANFRARSNPQGNAR
jgi:hypothetical protein